MKIIEFKTLSSQSIGKFHYSNYKNLNPKLLDKLNQIGWLRDNSGQNVKAGITKSLLQYSSDESIRELLNYINNSLQYYINNTCYHNSRNCNITDMWGVQYLKNESTDTHTHHPNTLAFVYFINSTKKDSPLIFCDSFYKFYGESGDLIIFPAYLKHNVPKQMNNNIRTTIAGNVLYTGWHY
jgi:hypothetical protein